MIYLSNFLLKECVWINSIYQGFKQKEYLTSEQRILSSDFNIKWKQAGAELGQAQYKIC